MEDMVTMKNYEEFILLYIDNELNAEEEQSLLALAAQHPEVSAELELYQSVKLQPDTTATYGDVSGLLKEEPASKTIAFGNWKTYAAAACVLLAVCIFFFNSNTSEPEILTAQNTVDNRPATPEQATIAEEADKHTQPSKAEPLPLAQEDTKQSQLRPKQPVAHIAMETKKQPVKEQVVITPDPVEPVIVKKENTAEKTIAKTIAPKKESITNKDKPIVATKKELQSIAAEEPTKPVIEDEPVLASTEEPKEKKLISVSGPLNSSIANIFKKKIETAKNATAQLKETDVVVQIGKKELFTVRF